MASISDLCELPRSGRGYTRAAYDATPSALSHALQDEVVRRIRKRETRVQIVQEMSAQHPEVTEYAVKRIWRAWREDPQAFGRKVSGIVAWTR